VVETCHAEKLAVHNLILSAGQFTQPRESPNSCTHADHRALGVSRRRSRSDTVRIELGSGREAIAFADVVRGRPTQAKQSPQ
jgi:hypothetical protein